MMWIFSSLTTAIQRVEGIPLPYLTSYDNNLLVILLICFFVTIIAFSRNSKYLMQFFFCGCENTKVIHIPVIML